MIKQSFIELFKELFEKGEILKAQYLVNECVPLDIKYDPDISDIQKQVNEHIQDIKRWGKEGRPYLGNHAEVSFDAFPKFVKARDIILDKHMLGSVLDIGCYSGVFIKEMSRVSNDCYGIDVHKELVTKLDQESLDIATLEFDFGSCEDIPLQDHRFDVVTVFDVLEHVIDLDKSISEIERVCKEDGLIIINLPRMTIGYKDESGEHLRMFDDEDINRIWGKKKNFKFEFCQDEHGNPTSFITYTNE